MSFHPPGFWFEVAGFAMKEEMVLIETPVLIGSATDPYDSDLLIRASTRALVAGIAIGFLLTSFGFGQQEEGERLVDAFILRCIDQSELYSVLCLQENVLEKRDENQKLIDVSQWTRVFRMVRSANLKSTRLEIRNGDGKVPFQSLYEHYLAFPGDHLIAFGLKPADFLPPKPIKKRPNRMISAEFPAVAFSNLTGLQNGNNTHLEDFGAARYFDRQELANGDIVLYVTLSRRVSYGRLVFKRFDSEYLPVNVEWFESPGFSPVKGSITSRDQCKDWRFYLGTATDWRRDEKHGFMPSRVLFRRESTPMQTEEAELKFLDWKIGEDVDVSLLSKDVFTRDQILKTVNFDDYENKFEKWKP